MTAKPKILVAPLNWGLGHASRMIPVIRELIFEGAEVIIGADAESHNLLKREFPELRHNILPDVRISYNDSWIKVSFKTLVNIFNEHRLLKKLIAAEQIDAIISDNRYGLYNKSIISVLVTHQTTPILPDSFKLFTSVFHKLLKHVFNRFDKIWIPDCQSISHNISGKLSHNANIRNAFFINPLSHIKVSQAENKKFDIAIVLSGPEPHRTDFENIIIEQAKASTKMICLVRGTQLSLEKPLSNNITIIDIANSREIAEIISHSDLLICRSGYSSIMDIWANNLKSVVVPTPNQPEQIYLADYLKDRIYTISQQEFNLAEIEKLTLVNFNNESFDESEVLKKTLQQLLIDISNRKRTEA